MLRSVLSFTPPPLITDEYCPTALLCFPRKGLYPAWGPHNARCTDMTNYDVSVFMARPSLGAETYGNGTLVPLRNIGNPLRRSSLAGTQAAGRTTGNHN